MLHIYAPQRYCIHIYFIYEYTYIHTVYTHTRDSGFIRCPFQDPALAGPSEVRPGGSPAGCSVSISNLKSMSWPPKERALTHTYSTALETTYPVHICLG